MTALMRVVTAEVHKVLLPSRETRLQRRRPYLLFNVISGKVKHEEEKRYRFSAFARVPVYTSAHS